MKVSVLGLGQMGTAIAERLNRRGPFGGRVESQRGQGGRSCAEGGHRNHVGARCVGGGCLSITMLADSAAFTEVALGKGGLAVADSGWGKFLIDMSTVSPESSSQVGTAAAANGQSSTFAPGQRQPRSGASGEPHRLGVG